MWGNDHSSCGERKQKLKIKNGKCSLQFRQSAWTCSISIVGGNLKLLVLFLLCKNKLDLKVLVFLSQQNVCFFCEKINSIWRQFFSKQNVWNGQADLNNPRVTPEHQTQTCSYPEVDSEKAVDKFPENPLSQQRRSDCQHSKQTKKSVLRYWRGFSG